MDPTVQLRGSGIRIPGPSPRPATPLDSKNQANRSGRGERAICRKIFPCQGTARVSARHVTRFGPIACTHFAMTNGNVPVEVSFCTKRLVLRPWQRARCPFLTVSSYDDLRVSRSFVASLPSRAPVPNFPSCSLGVACGATVSPICNSDAGRADFTATNSRSCRHFARQTSSYRSEATTR